MKRHSSLLIEKDATDSQCNSTMKKMDIELGDISTTEGMNRSEQVTGK